MPAAYLHGVETIEVEKGAVTIKSVKTAVIGLIGTAPIYEAVSEDQKINEPIQILNPTDAAKYFGSSKSGYTIPQALNAIFDQGSGLVIVVNVLDPATHKTSVADEEKTFDSDDKLALDNEGVANEVVKNIAGTTTYVKDTDYTIDYPKGEITKKAGGDLSAKKSSLNIDCTNANSDVTYEAVTAGVGGDDITIAYIDPSGASQSLSISVTNNAITVNLATDGTNAIISTAAEIETAINGDTNASALVTATKENDGSGIVEAKSAANLADGQDKVDDVKISYDYVDPSLVTASEIIGGIDEGGNKTGMEAFKNTYQLFGYFAKLLISPVYCTQNSVASALNVIAADLRAFALIDAPIGTTFAQAITGRGPEGEINFNYSSDRLILCYPHLKVYNTETEQEELEPSSQRFAGVIAAKDVEKGYWWSPSNTEIKGIIGVERVLTAMINDPNSEVNVLNENGIMTIFNSFGSGLRTWGNRSSAFPSVTHVKNFINIRRVADIIHESIEYAMLQHIDKPLNNAFISVITETVNSFIRTLIGRGALIDGKCWYVAANNPETEISAGRVRFEYDFMPPTPAERISFYSSINIEYLKALGGE